MESEAAETKKEARRRKKKELNRLTNDIYFEKYQVMLFVECLGWLIILVLSLIWCGICIENLNDAKRSLYNPDIWTAEWILAASIICAGVHVLFCPLLLDKFPFGIAVTLRVISLRFLLTVMKISLNYFRDIDYVSLGVDELFLNFNMLHFISEALSLYFLDKARLSAREKLEPETCVPIWKRGFFGGEKKKKEADAEAETEKNV
nr:MAG TPA: hypothetical protein [Caudoviricetes sp.]